MSHFDVVLLMKNLDGIINSWHSRGTQPLLSPPSLSPAFLFFLLAPKMTNCPGHSLLIRLICHTERGRERRAERERNKGGGREREGEYKKFLVGSETSSPVDSPLDPLSISDFFQSCTFWTFLWWSLGIYVSLTLSPIQTWLGLTKNISREFQ